MLLSLARSPLIRPHLTEACSSNFSSFGPSYSTPGAENNVNGTGRPPAGAAARQRDRRLPPALPALQGAGLAPQRGALSPRGAERCSLPAAPRPLSRRGGGDTCGGGSAGRADYGRCVRSLPRRYAAAGLPVRSLAATAAALSSFAAGCLVAQAPPARWGLSTQRQVRIFAPSS